MEKRQGALYFDREEERYNIRFGLEECYHGLYCGEGLEVLVEMCIRDRSIGKQSQKDTGNIWGKSGGYPKRKSIPTDRGCRDGPVSYTHLDVYKRQLLQRSI